VYVFTLHDKEFPIYRAVHGITGSIILVVSIFVSAHVHTPLSLLIFHWCRRICGTLCCCAFTCTTQRSGTRREWLSVAIWSRFHG
jgi:hypothetical protein